MGYGLEMRDIHVAAKTPSARVAHAQAARNIKSDLLSALVLFENAGATPEEMAELVATSSQHHRLYPVL